ncbi:tRNA (adenosine(37)-N6)-threonylcarbamoyltransferase complex ATPase subunit type 1 TsaE [Chloroflexota bacterium]
MNDNQQKFNTKSRAGTIALGKAVGALLDPGNVLALIGELGSGKTVLTKGICAGLGVPERLVNSPTFIIVNEYRGQLPVFHLDVYRLGGSEDALDFGLADYAIRAKEGVMIIEWAEKIMPVLPADCLRVEITQTGVNTREIVCTDTTGKFEKMLEKIKVN